MGLGVFFFLLFISFLLGFSFGFGFRFRVGLGSVSVMLMLAPGNFFLSGSGAVDVVGGVRLTHPMSPIMP